MKQPTIIMAQFEHRDLYDKTLDEWEKFRKDSNPKVKNTAHSFAYWLFRYSGLIIKERLKDEEDIKRKIYEFVFYDKTFKKDIKDFCHKAPYGFKGSDVLHLIEKQLFKFCNWLQDKKLIVGKSGHGMSIQSEIYYEESKDEQTTK